MQCQKFTNNSNINANNLHAFTRHFKMNYCMSIHFVEQYKQKLNSINFV